MQHQPRKRFGQNFLQDKSTINRILNAISPKAMDNLLEIGPGLGALTKPLLDHVDQLTAIEIDQNLQQHLNTGFGSLQKKLTVIGADALNIDYNQFGTNLRIVGNLPYNVSTPLLIKLLPYHENIKDMHFMLQQEVVDRLVASHGQKKYGRLSVMTQYYFQTAQLFSVPATAFYPEPKVQSAVIRLTPHRVISETLPFNVLEQVIRQAFSTRRKTLVNNLKPLINQEAISNLDIDPRKRPEQLTVNEFTTIAKFCHLNQGRL